ncbi:MAG: aromatic acid exporter family protein [Actinomycetes bacterium]
MKAMRRVIRLFTDRRAWVQQVVVTAAAAATAWQIGDIAFKNGGLVAAIVASLTVRISLHKSTREGFGQILGTAIGAGTALLSVSLFGFGAVTVGVTVVMCSVAARAMHLGEVASINVPVTALIVIGPGISENNAQNRMVSTLIGASIAILFSYFAHPKTPAGRTIDQIASLGTKAAQLLGTMSEGVAAGFTQREAGNWLASARLLIEEIPRVRAQALEARTYAKWFPTAEKDEAEDLYSRGVAIEHTVVQVRTIARTLFDSAVEGGIPDSTQRKIAEALSAASFAISSDVEELLKDGSAGDNPQLTADMRLVGAELVDLLINESPAEDQEQIARSMSLVTNLDRIADSLDQASPAMFAVETPTEPQGQKVLSLSPLEQGRKWRRNFRKVLPKKLRKYF